jgi:hypothetical protein
MIRTMVMLATVTVSSVGPVGAWADPPPPLAGCVAKADGGFLVKTPATASAGRRTGGSSSAKASTPIGVTESAALAPRKGTAGAYSAKASTPIGVATPTPERPRTAGSVTPKGSVPLRSEIESARPVASNCGASTSM